MESPGDVLMSFGTNQYSQCKSNANTCTHKPETCQVASLSLLRLVHLEATEFNIEKGNDGFMIRQTKSGLGLLSLYLKCITPSQTFLSRFYLVVLGLGAPLSSPT